MHRRFLAGWKGVVLATTLAGLILLPISGVFAAPRPQSDVTQSDAGFTVAGQEENTLRQTTFARSTYAWPYATGPYYGDVEPQDRRNAGVLQTPVGSFYLGRGEINIPTELTGKLKFESLPAQYFILQHHPDVLRSEESFDALRRAVLDNGGAWLDAMPIAAHLVRLNPAALAAVQAQPGVLSVIPYHPAFKLHPSIGRSPLVDSEMAISEVYDLDIAVFAGEDPGLVAEAIRGLGGNVSGIWPDTVRATLHRSRLAALAALEPVKMVYEHQVMFGLGEETTTTMQTGAWNLGATPYTTAGIDGTGEVLMVLDSGYSVDAGDLSETRTTPGTPSLTHRKVLTYEATNQFGGQGDDKSCDAFASGGSAHGHVVASTALGHATDTGAAYGGAYEALDSNNNPWSLNGVVPNAKLVAYDGRVTPAISSCASTPGILSGNLFTPGQVGSNRGSLGQSYEDFGADTANFSWGGTSNAYDINASDIDDFMDNHRDGLVFVSAGNQGSDIDGNNRPDAGTLGAPATTKNGFAVGASGTADDTISGTGPDFRIGFSSAGPADCNFITCSSNPLAFRVAPQIMAPGADVSAMGMASEFACRSDDNDQVGAVVCDVISGFSGTSFASPAAAGAAVLVRDYFAGGFYPDGTDQNPSNAADQVPTVSGALVKAIMIASAEFLHRGTLHATYRFNNEQGYGRVQLDNALPIINWNDAAIGLIVADGDTAGGANNTSLAGSVGPSPAVDTTTFNVCDDTQELRVGLAWVEPAGSALLNDLNLEIVSPSGKTYYGNYYTDDNNRNESLDTLPPEDCPGHDGVSGTLNNSEWSLATCANSVRDSVNPTEAIHLSPDPDGNGVTDDGFSQIELGDWTLNVRGGTFSSGTSQAYAVAISGPVCIGSNIRINKNVFACNEAPTITVNETDEADDPGSGLTPAAIDARTTLQVIDPGPDGLPNTADDVVIDSESPGSAGVPGFARQGTCSISGDVCLDATADCPAGETCDTLPTTLKFQLRDFTLTDGTAPQSNNGALDVQHGMFVKAIYADESTTIPGPDPDQERTNTAGVDCAVDIRFGDLVFSQFGRDSAIFKEGGCERNARGFYEFGFPDRYMDAGEYIGLRFAFASAETEDMTDVVASLKCVATDADSPADCRPGTADCADPNRENNPPCTQLTILDPVKQVGDVPSNSAIAANFNIEMASAITGEPSVELVLGVSAEKSGRRAEGIAVHREKLDVDAFELLYSTDFPTGGTVEVDWNNDEVIEPAGSVVTNLGDPELDYRFETITFADMTATGMNTGISAPWNFNTNHGGMLGGRSSISDEVTDIVAQWGEDLNFNGAPGGVPEGTCSVAGTACFTAGDCPAGQTCDAEEDRDPVNGLLDQNWSTQGGCGWQTKAAGDLTGGAWHTGGIRAPGQASCLVSGATPGDCQTFETVTGTQAQKGVFEVLLTPQLEKVNQDLDAEGQPIYTASITGFNWNASLDLPDDTGFSLITWEVDIDAAAEEPQTLTNDGSILNLFSGPYGAVSGGSNVGLTDGYPMFAPLDATQNNSVNGTVGNNREGDNSCFFEGGAVSATNAGTINTADPPDDDLDNDSDTFTDENVTSNGPLRNFDLSHFNGPGMRFTILEDIYGDTGNSFQGALGFFTSEGDTMDQPLAGFGMTVDDLELQWKEVRLDPDTTDCATAGPCATIELETTNFFEGNALMTVTALEPTPDAVSNCDLNHLCSVAATACDLDADCPAGETCEPDFGNDPANSDCNGDGTFPDLPIKATSEVELAGEIFYLNQVSPGSSQYVGTFPVSAAYDIPGTLFVQRRGTDQPSVIVEYEDNDTDGAGTECQNDADPAKHGRVTVATTIFVPAGNMQLVQLRLVEVAGGGGDTDGIADTSETLDAFPTLTNLTGLPLNGVVARLSSNDPNIECIIQPTVSFGTFPAEDADGTGATIEATEAFRFKVADTVARAGEFDDISATFSLTVSSSEFDATINPIEYVIDLDLDISGGAGPTNFTEDFETAGSLGAFVAQEMDAGIASNAASDGLRCQYNDPDNPNANSYGETKCYLGAADQTPTSNFEWHQHNVGHPDGGRAYTNTGSVHYGIHAVDPGDDTTPLATLEAIRTSSPINLDYTGTLPELSFKHQIQLVDDRATNTPPGEAPDRAVVHIQLANALGNPQGNWIKLIPYQNTHDRQGTQQFVDCTFDPTDDGNNEDSFFDPTDPDARLGPSSTCFPELAFNYLGDTFHENAFSPIAIGRASDGPGLQGNLGNGTWVESRFNLARYIGRRLRLRFLATSIEVNDNVDYESAFRWNPIGFDDGWYIDDIQINNTLTTPATVVADTKPNTGLLTCADFACTTLTADLVATPPSSTAPGIAVELSAAGSSADSCPNGTLQYQFWIDGNANGIVGDAGDTRLRDWTDNPVYVDAPSADTQYGVLARCSADPACGGLDAGAATALVTVACPGGAGSLGPFYDPTTDAEQITFSNATTVSWPTSQLVVAIQGDLDALRAGSGTGSGNFAGTVNKTLLNTVTANSFVDNDTPAAGSGLYYLVRRHGCNTNQTWSTGEAEEVTGRDSTIP